MVGGILPATVTLYGLRPGRFWRRRVILGRLRTESLRVSWTAEFACTLFRVVIQQKRGLKTTVDFLPLCLAAGDALDLTLNFNAGSPTICDRIMELGRG